jgi:acetyltransferase-like isoleucine patch superfamily enzyme
MAPFIHKTVDLAESAQVGDNTKIWSLAQVRDHAVIGENCIIGRNVFIDEGVTLGNNCKVQNNALLYAGVTLEDGVFVGPAVCFTNDKLPRAINPDGTLKSAQDWIVGKILVKYGAAVGAQSVVVTGVTLGRFCLVGSGSVVTKDVPDFGIVVGNPARLVGYACRCATRLVASETDPADYTCPNCSRSYRLLNKQLTELS